MLAVDANILLSMASDQKAKNLVDALRTWMPGLAGKAHPAPRGKMVTVLVTKCMLHDYRAGLRRGGYGVNQGTKKAFHSYTGKGMPLDRDSNMWFSVRVVYRRGLIWEE